MEWRSLLFTFGPLLLPRILPYLVTFYRELRYSSSRPDVRPAPAEAKRALNVLFFSILAFLILSLPYFADENIFALTQARLQTENSVLFTRLALRRTGSTLTDADARLKDRLQTLDGRLLYLQYGHDALANCLFCTTAEPDTFLYYSLPTMLTPHLVHLAMIGVLTSRIIAGPDAARWRSYAGFAAMVIAGVEVYSIMTYGNLANKVATRASDIVSFHWTARTIRYLSFALFDTLFACILYLTATRRFFVTTVPVIQAAIERTADIARILESQNIKVTSLGALRNTVMRDSRLRQRLEQYWTEERTMMGEIDQEKEVVESLNKAVEGMDMQSTEGKAAEFAELFINSMRTAPRE